MKVGRNKWTITPQVRPEAAVRLLCFHHACAGAYTFRAWPAMLRSDVELVAVQLPGRENRYSEPLLSSAEALLDGLIGSLRDSIGPRYAVFGHSLGALLAYLLACRVRRTGELALPVRLFLSSACVPKTRSSDHPAGSAFLSDQALIEKMSMLGGTPAEILNDRAFLNEFLPVFRADLAILSQVSFTAEHALDIPFTLLGGSDDPTVHPADIEAWRGFSSQPCDTHILQGGHFYHQRSQAALLEIVNATLGDHMQP